MGLRAGEGHLAGTEWSDRRHVVNRLQNGPSGGSTGIVLLVLAMVLASCGGGDGGDTRVRAEAEADSVSGTTAADNGESLNNNVNIVNQGEFTWNQYNVVLENITVSELPTGDSGANASDVRVVRMELAGLADSGETLSDLDTVFIQDGEGNRVQAKVVEEGDTKLLEFVVDADATELNLGIAAAGEDPTLFQLTEPASTGEEANGFRVAFGDRIAPGVPGAGAGDHPSPDTSDTYTFDVAEAGQRVFLDFHDCYDSLEPRWDIVGPTGANVTSNEWCDDAFVDLPTAGEHELVVRADDDSFGPYAVSLLAVPPADGPFEVSLGDDLSPGSPEAGAGHAEAPGAVDRYVFDFDDSGGETMIFLDWSDCFDGSEPRWDVVGPDGSAVSSDNWCNDEFVVLPTSGEYELRVRSNSEEFGTYAVQLVGVPAADGPYEVVLGDNIAVDEPARGAGRIEAPGAVDRFVFDFDDADGQTSVFVDWQDCFGGSEPRWDIVSEDGSSVASDEWCNDSFVELPTSGEYELRVRSNSQEFGTYELDVLAVPTAEGPFDIALGDSVRANTPGPGAGNIEAPGAIDRYTFDVPSGGTTVALEFTDCYEGSEPRWTIRNSDRAVVVENQWCNDAEVELPTAGQHTLEMFSQSENFGSYSFTISG